MTYLHFIQRNIQFFALNNSCECNPNFYHSAANELKDIKGEEEEEEDNTLHYVLNKISTRNGKRFLEK